MSSPRVSVIVPVYNGAAYLADAIRSVLGQTMEDLEVIVVNDGSTDDSGAIAGAFTDARCRVVDRPNGGVARARNSGLDAAQGAYIGFLDADDAMLPTNVAEKLEALERTGADWVFGDLALCNAELEPTGQLLKGTDGDVLATLLRGIEPAVPASCSNALFRRSCFAGFEFDATLSNAADQYLTAWMASRHSYTHLPKALNRYRVLPNSMSRNIDLYAADQLRFLERVEAMGLLNDPDLRREVLSNAYWSIAGSHAVNGRAPLKALPFLLRSVRTDPRILLRRLHRGR